MKPILKDLPIEFTTERLRIRLPRIGDGQSIYECIRHSKREFEPWLPFALGEQSAEQSERFVRQSIANFIRKKSLNFLVILMSENVVIASVGCHHIDWNTLKVEIGYWLDTRFSGKGYMTESVAAITNLAFEKLHAKCITIRCDATNVKSRKIPERLGYELEAKTTNSQKTDFSPELVEQLIFEKSAKNK